MRYYNILKLFVGTPQEVLRKNNTLSYEEVETPTNSSMILRYQTLDASESPYTTFFRHQNFPSAQTSIGGFKYPLYWFLL